MTPEQQTVPADPGNGLLAEGPAALTSALVQTPAGQRLLVTVRTTSATVTVFLNQADAQAWGGQISACAGQMSASGLIVAAPGLPNGKVTPFGQ